MTYQDQKKFEKEMTNDGRKLNYGQTSITNMQKRYIWLAGSYSKLVLVQGRGYRSMPTKYGIDEEMGQLVVFGYSNPPEFLERRGIFRKLQMLTCYVLTEKGEGLFRQLLVNGAGTKLNKEVKEVKLKNNNAR